MEDQDQDIILLWEEEPLDDFGEPPEELFEEPPGEPPGEPPDEPLGEPPGEPPREPPSEPPREPPEKPPEELSYADQPVFEHVLPTTPIVSELIPISVLDTLSLKLTDMFKIPFMSQLFALYSRPTTATVFGQLCIADL